MLAAGRVLLLWPPRVGDAFADEFGEGQAAQLCPGERRVRLEPVDGDAFGLAVDELDDDRDAVVLSGDGESLLGLRSPGHFGHRTLGTASSRLCTPLRASNANWAQTQP